MSTLSLSLAGGAISFASTAFGSLLAGSEGRSLPFSQFKFSMDFALGLMLSAVAFSLVGPAAANSIGHPELILQGLAAFAFGALLIYGLRSVIEKRQTEKSSQLILAISLMVHNLPEGMASGAALAGLETQTALSLILSIALQNLPEGLLMVLSLRSLGFSSRIALLGGLGSGLVEFLGGGISGLAMTWTSEALPLILMSAGGAMFTAVAIEVSEKGNLRTFLQRPEFAYGFLIIPVLSLLPSISIFR